MTLTQIVLCRRCILAFSSGTTGTVRLFSNLQEPGKMTMMPAVDTLLPTEMQSKNQMNEVSKPSRKLDSTTPIYTLDPNNFAATGQQMVNFSRKNWTVVGSLSETVKFPSLQKKGQTFPQGSRGYIYYRKPQPGEHEATGALRLRVMPPSARSFAEGKDLEYPDGTPDGTPWKVGIYSIVHFGNYAPILKMLLEENAVSKDIVANIKKIPQHRFDMRSVVLFAPSDTFVTNMQSTPRSLKMVSVGSMMTIDHFPRTVFFSRSASDFPYRGLLRLRLEKSPFPQHAKSSHAVIRVIEILEPVERLFLDSDVEIAEPVEGELLRKRYKGKKEHEIYRYHMRSSSYRMFEHFFGNSNPFT